MDDQVFEANRRLLGEVRVQADGARVVIATSPFRPHLSHVESIHLHAHAFLPLGDQRWDRFSEQRTVPGVEQLLAFHCIRSRADLHVESLVTELNTRSLVGFGEGKQITLSPNVMAFALKELAFGLPILPSDFGLLFANPFQFGNGVDPDGIQLHAAGSGNAHGSGGWVDAEMDVLDVLLQHIDRHVSQVERGAHASVSNRDVVR